MKTLGQKVIELETIIREVEQFFRIQEQYFNDRTDVNLTRLRIQQAKVKIMIQDSKKPIPTLI